MSHSNPLPHAREDALFLRALRREEVPRPPVWMMRQAGRYLPEYRAVREKASFLDLCRDAELGCEVSLQPIRRFDFDAAIIFSDILFPLIAMGADFRFGDGGPKLAQPFDTEESFDRLHLVDAREELPWIHAALKLLREKLDPSKAVLGFAGAPFTLLAYLVEGQTSRLYPRTKAFLWHHPDTARRVLELLADQVGDYLVEQLKSGADAVQFFDTWAGLLSPEDYGRWALPYAKRVAEKVHAAKGHCIYYLNGGASLIEAQVEAGADAVSVDWRVEPAELRTRVAEETVLQGNLDPLVLLGPPEFVARRTKSMLDALRGRRGYIANLGHGVIPETPIESVASFVSTIQAWRA
ncbi:MAG TPA: uroporphyrinogen decarboxylase [Candidatus Krumholzibacteria bacterium]|nr:uroporphyrinogen decarboxylase [Candidatus Krumholzibacteria bacterium]